MYVKALNKNSKGIIFAISILSLLILVTLTHGQDNSLISITKEANSLIAENRYLDALPLLEKIIPFYPNDKRLWAYYGIALINNSATIADPQERKQERQRAMKALRKAKKLGTTNVIALNLLDTFPTDGSGKDNFAVTNRAVSNALRKGELFFGKGKYNKAFKEYKRAHKLDPLNYEAVLFMGDCLYAQKKYKKSEPFFAKAIKINPTRETAYQFWGDALLLQKKYSKSLDKFLDALIAKPLSRMSWNNLRRWARETDSTFSIPNIAPPGNSLVGSLKIDVDLLKQDNGTQHWKIYTEIVNNQSKKRALENRMRTFNDEEIAWKKVANATRQDIREGKILYPDKSLVTLVRLNDAQLIKPYILLLRPKNIFSKDIFAYLDSKRGRGEIKQFIRKFVLNLKN